MTVVWLAKGEEPSTLGKSHASSKVISTNRLHSESFTAPIRVSSTKRHNPLTTVWLSPHIHNPKMIGMVNVPCDSPLDFYASPSRQDSIMSKDSFDSVRYPGLKQKQSSYRPLFTAAHRKKIQYTEDGRKISDGAIVEQCEPNKLWEELFLRSFAQRLENEIQSPIVESFNKLDSELTKLNVKDKNLYRSTYSLVSAARIEEATTLEELDRIELKQTRSGSQDRGSIYHLLPFFKNLKGKKDKKIKKST